MSRILVTGASGLVGAHVFRALERADHAVIGSFCEHGGRVPVSDPRSSLIALDLADPRSVEKAFRQARPDAVIHTAALSDLGRCERLPEEARRINVEATIELAGFCRQAGARLIYCSSDQVFDGERGGYIETDATRPLHVYGRTKQEAERRVAEACPGATALRIGLVLGASPSGSRSASEQIVLALAAGERPRLFTDEFRTPVVVDQIACVILELISSDGPDLLHLAGPDRISRYELGRMVARIGGLDATLIEPVRLSEVPLTPRRPRDLSLNIDRLRSLIVATQPPLEQALRDSAVAL